MNTDMVKDIAWTMAFGVLGVAIANRLPMVRDYVAGTRKILGVV